MPAYTSPDNIQYPVSTDQVAPLETVFANMAQSTQNAFDGFRSDWNDFEANRAIQTFRWADATVRAAQTGMQSGDIGYQIDAALSFRYTGSAWTPISPGLVPLIPTVAGSGVSVSANGLVTCTAASTARMNGLTGYSQYLVEIEVYGSTSNQAIYLQMANGSTVETGAVYGYTGSLLVSSSTSFTSWNASSGSTIDTARVTNTSTAPSQIQARISSLNPARRTRFAVESGGHNGTALMQFDLHGEVATTTAYDGINIAIQSGAMTGTIRVYGLL